MNKSLLIFCLIGISLFIEDIQAQRTFQEGYIITNTGDTVKGQVDYRQWAFNPSVFTFRPSAGNVVSYQPTDIREFHIVNGEFYISRTVSLDLSMIKIANLIRQEEAKSASDTTLFLRVIIKAKTSLYYFKDVNDQEHYYVEKEGSKPVELLLKKSIKETNENSTNMRNYIVTVETFKGQLIVLFADCIQLKEDINKSEYDTRSLKNLILKYNECMGETPVYVAKSQNLKVKFGIVAGPFYGTLKLKGSATVDINGSEFTPYFSGVAGVALHFILPRQRAQWDIINELTVKPYSTSGTNFSGSYSWIYYNYNFSFNLVYLKLNTMLRYVYPKWNVKPFGNIGMSNGFALKKTNSKTVEKHSAGGVTFTTGDAMDGFRTYELGFLGGAGVQWKHLSAEFRYEWSNGMSPYSALTSNVSTMYLLISWTF